MYKFLLLGFLFCITAVKGQGISDLFQEDLVFRVKQLDQFISRFNYEEDMHGEKLTNDTSALYSKQKMFASLFNLELMSDLNNRKEATDFIQEIETSGTKLSYFDDSWYATLACKAKYQGETRDITFVLSYDGDFFRGARWVITGADAGFIEKDTTTFAKIIPPTNHNVNFIDLIGVINTDAENIEDYTIFSTQNKSLQHVIRLIKDKKLVLVNTSEPTFHFLQIQNWIFTVDFFNRSSKNSGWLISSLNRVKEVDLHKYKRDQLYLF